MQRIRRGRVFIARSQFTPQHTLFRRLLREARLSAGLTQTQLGDRLGIHQLLISRGEMGDRKTDIIDLYEMCEAMGISFVDFTRDLADALSALQAQTHKEQDTSPKPTALQTSHANSSQPERTRRVSPRKPPTTQRKRP